MSLLSKLPYILEEGRAEYLSLKDKRVSFAISERISQGKNMLANGDNLAFMQYLLEDHHMAERLQLVYIDPPFFSKANYGTEVKLESHHIEKMPVIKQKAYHDVWEDGMEEYLQMLVPRLYMIRDLLKEEGCLWVHLDWHGVHYVKILLDEIFGEKNFINEVIWHYKSGGVSKRYFARKHDTLLFYAKSADYYFKAQKEKSYNRDFKPYRFKGVEEYQDNLGWYTMVNMKDVWQINMVGRTSGERTGYATQKPEQLLERILESCTQEGDLCADFFGGSGTLAAVADRMKRSWIYSDIGRLAAANAHKRMTGKTLEGYDFYLEEGLQERSSEIVAELRREVLEGSEKLRVTLKSYRPVSLKDIAIDMKYIDIIEEIIEKDSLQLIDYWAVDFDYDGQTFKPERHFAKGSPTMSFVCESGQTMGNLIGIRAIDIFGKSSFAILPVLKKE